MGSSIAWSKSSLDQILYGCAHAWKLKKVDGLPDAGTPATAGGTAHHAGVELHEQRRIDARRAGREAPVTSLDEMVAHSLVVLDTEWAELEANAPHLHRHDDLPTTRTAVEASLTNWYMHGLRDRVMQMVPLYREPYFNVGYGGATIHGYIDQVNWDPEAQAWVIVDDKTAGNYNRWPHDGAGHETELTVYVAGTLAAPGLPGWPDQPVTMEWHIARKRLSDHASFEPTRIVRATVEPWMKDQLVHELASAERMVAEQDFPKMPSHHFCSPRWCPFMVDNGGPCDPNEP